jgi:hypothetical protein
VSRVGGAAVVFCRRFCLCYDLGVAGFGFCVCVCVKFCEADLRGE